MTRISVLDSQAMQPALQSLFANPAALIALGAVVLALVAVIAVLTGRKRDQSAELASKISLLAEQQAIAQNQLTERLQSQERALTKSLDERLEAVSRRVVQLLGQDGGPWFWTGTLSLICINAGIGLMIDSGMSRGFPGRQRSS